MNLCPIDRHSINTAYHSCYLPSLTYSLPATSFVKEDLHDIQNKGTGTFLSRLGYNRHFPSEVVYAPRWFGGIGLRHLYCEQGIGKTQRLLAHIRSQSKLGRIFLTNIDWYQQLSGLPKPILTDTSYIPGTRNQWLTSLRIFLHETRSHIQLEDEWCHPPLRINDIHIMSLVQHADLNDIDKERLNVVRQYLKVTTIAELFNNDGKTFHRGAFAEIDNSGNLLLR